MRGTVITRHREGQKIRDCSKCTREPKHYFSRRDPREHVIVCEGCYDMERSSCADVAISVWNRRQRGAG